MRASLVEPGPSVQSDGPRVVRRGRPVVFHADDVPPTVQAAFRGQATKLLPTCGLITLIPGGTDLERGALTVPLFLGFGEHDLSNDVRDTGSSLRILRRHHLGGPGRLRPLSQPGGQPVPAVGASSGVGPHGAARGIGAMIAEARA